MDKDTTESTFREILNQFPIDKFNEIIKETELDKYVKKLFTPRLLFMMIYAQISKVDSYGELAGKIDNNADLQEMLKLDSISDSQLSRRLSEIDSGFWETAFSLIAQYVTPKITHQLNTLAYADRLHIIDASTVTLCLNSYPWADYRKTKAGIKIHQSLVYYNGNSYPDKAILTTARTSDKSQLDELITADPNGLHAFDRGYVDYKQWDTYCDAGIRFVTRLKSNAIIDIIEQVPVDNTNMTESIVVLGDPKTRMRNKLRLIQTTDSEGKPIVIVTNDFKISAQDISEVYRRRWQVELFFKWIKQHLKVKRFFGKSQNAVFAQIWHVLITYCLLLLIKVNSQASKSLLDIKRLLEDTLFKPYADFLEALQSNRCRQGVDEKLLIMTSNLSNC